MEISELRKDHRIQAFKGVFYTNGQNCPECVWCGAMLPLDEQFQAMHRQQCQAKLAEHQERELEEQRARLNHARITEIRRRGSGYG